MSLSKKIIFSFLLIIIFIVVSNLIAFYFFYTYYFKLYLEEKLNNKKEITKEYINELIKKQTLDEIDNVFVDVELQLFELLEKNKWVIPITNEENRNIVINYLLKAWVSLKYLEDLIPQNYIKNIINSLKDKNSPESKFLKNLLKSIIIINILIFFASILFLIIFTRKIIKPIQKTTNAIKKLEIWKEHNDIEYNKKDEIWLLVQAINELKKKLIIQENIRNKMLADISHELKTPITSIQCYLEGIKDKTIKVDEPTLNTILYEMQRLIKLVNKIMEYEKYETSELSLNIKQEDVRYITEQVIKQFKQKLKTNNQKIITSWFSKKLNIDKDSFIQIVQNIISNFIKYAWQNTTLKIDFQNNYISFKDDWVWIPKNEIPFIKEKFYQVKKEKTWNIEDRWIWVWFSIIEKIVKAFWWKIEIYSEENKWFEIKIFTKNSH